MRKQNGFTLIEVMVAISVLAILMSVGVPSMLDFVRNNRRAAAVNALVTDLQRARNSAASTGDDIVLCHSVNGTACTGASSPDWSEGWLLFRDLDSDDTLDPDEEVLSRQTTRSGLTMPSNKSGLVFRAGFRPLGFFGSSGGGGTIRVCIDGTDNDRAIVINAAGRPRTDTTNCS